MIEDKISASYKETKEQNRGEEQKAKGVEYANLLHLKHISLHGLQLFLCFLALSEDLLSWHSSIVELPEELLHLSLRGNKMHGLGKSCCKF